MAALIGPAQAPIQGGSRAAAARKQVFMCVLKENTSRQHANLR